MCAGDFVGADFFGEGGFEAGDLGVRVFELRDRVVAVLGPFCDLGDHGRLEAGSLGACLLQLGERGLAVVGPGDKLGFETGDLVARSIELRECVISFDALGQERGFEQLQSGPGRAELDQRLGVLDFVRRHEGVHHA